MVRKLRVNKGRRLLHIHLLLEGAMKKRIVDIKLSDRPTRRNSKIKNKSNNGGFDNRTEGVIVVNVYLLMVTLYLYITLVLLCSLLRPRKKFLLSHLLHVLEITKNIISVCQFCEDNVVYFQFHSHKFFVKDAVSHTILL